MSATVETRKPRRKRTAEKPEAAPLTSATCTLEDLNRLRDLKWRERVTITEAVSMALDAWEKESRTKLSREAKGGE